MVDGPARLNTRKFTSPKKVKNSKSYCYLKFVGQRNNTVGLLRDCYIKLRRIKIAFNVNNSQCMHTTPRKKRVVSKVSLLQSSITKCEVKKPYMSRKQQRNIKQKKTRETRPQYRKQMLRIPAQSTQIQSTQKDCKKLVVKVKRLNLEKQPCFDKDKYNISCSLKSKPISAEHAPCEELCLNSQTSINLEALQDQCSFEKSPVASNINRAIEKLKSSKFKKSKDKQVPARTAANVLQHQYTNNVIDNLNKSEFHATNPIKKAVVRLKRFKDSITKPLKSTNTATRTENPLVLQDNTFEDLEQTKTLVVTKRAVVRLKRFKDNTTRPLKTTNAALPTGNIYENPEQTKIPAVYKRAVVRLKRLKLDYKTGSLAASDQPKVNSKTDAKMKTRQNDTKKVETLFKKSSFASKAKEKLSQQTFPSNVFLKQNELITNLVITPERRNNLKKLSLRNSLRNPKSMDANATKIFEISRFSPVRNSTVFEIGENPQSEVAQKEKSTNDKKTSGVSKKKNKAVSISKVKSSRKSLTNNPNLIEDLLFSKNYSDEEQETCTGEEENEITRNIKENENRTHKFFHRLPEKKSNSNKVPTETENIFEFLSQSDTSGSEKGKINDATADVIKKMISAGKVRVAVNRKGTGRPVLKRARPKYVRKKQPTNKTIASKTRGKKEKATSTVTNEAIRDVVHNNVEGNAPLPTVQEFMEDDHHDANEYFNDQSDGEEPMSEGGFSRLARSVLLQQTKKYENTRKKDLTEQRRLLEIARKFVSTPAPNRKSATLPQADFSPIQTLNRPVCPSPWRIDDDAHLPRVFNFNKNTSYMPSFSSDYIPPTPKKNKKNGSQICNDSNAPFEKSTLIGKENANNVQSKLTNSDSNCELQASLGSSHDSNAENMPPPSSTPARQVPNNDENADIFNLRQLPNPRRTLEHRSPLKPINIIEVVNLPAWKKTANNDGQNKKSNAPTIGCDSSKSDESHNVDDLFGFEEFLDPNSDDEHEPSSVANKTKASRQSIKRNLHKKLKDLEKWRPKNHDHDEPNATVKPCRVFDDNEGRPKQRLIKEMLCSTMVNQMNSKHAEQAENMEDRNEGNVQPIENDFFNDYEPETTFAKKPQRTYARPVKKKRKGRKNFVMFLDSSAESNSDSDEEQHHDHRKVGQKKRRNEAHANNKENLELKSFVNEFNSMCKEVDNYELLVE